MPDDVVADECYGLNRSAPLSASLARRDAERQLGHRLPDSVASLFQVPGLMEAVASAYTNNAVFPASVRRPNGTGRPGRRSFESIEVSKNRQRPSPRSSTSCLKEAEWRNPSFLEFRL